MNKPIFNLMRVEVEFESRQGVEFNFSRADPGLPHTKNFYPILYVSVWFSAHEIHWRHVYAI